MLTDVLQGFRRMMNHEEFKHETAEEAVRDVVFKCRAAMEALRPVMVQRMLAPVQHPSLNYRTLQAKLCDPAELRDAPLFGHIKKLYNFLDAPNVVTTSSPSTGPCRTGTGTPGKDRGEVVVCRIEISHTDMKVPIDCIYVHIPYPVLPGNMWSEALLLLPRSVLLIALGFVKTS